jgi:YVTN family beta-propeller protein
MPSRRSAFFIIPTCLSNSFVAAAAVFAVHDTSTGDAAAANRPPSMSLVQDPPAPSAATPAIANPAVILYSTRGDSKLHVLSADDLSLIGSHDLGVGAHELAVSPDGRWAVGSAYGGPGAGHQPADSRLAVFDLSSGKVHRTVDFAPLSRPNDAAFLPDSVHAYITVESPPRIVRVNVDTGEHKPITLDRGTNHMLALSPDGKRLYVAHVIPGGLSVIDTATDAVLSHIALPDGAEGIAVSRDGQRVWVSCNRSDKVVIVDTASGSVERTIECSGFPFRLRLSPDASTVAVSLPKTDEISLFDASDPSNVRRVPLRDAQKPAGPALVPTSIAFTRDGSRIAAVCSGGQGEIVLVDVSEGKVIARRKTDGPIPDALAAR